MPISWAEVTLGEVSEITAGIGFPNEYQGKKNGEIPFYKVSDISYAVLNTTGILSKANNYVSSDESQILKGKIIQPQATVFAKIGEAVRLNRRAIVSKPCLVDNNVMAVKAIENFSDKYLYYFLRTVDFSQNARSTTVPSLRKGDVESLMLPVAPLAEQRRIAEKLDTVLTRVDAVQDRLARITPLLKRFRQSILAAATSGRLTEVWRNFNQDESDWKKVTLKEVAKDFSYGSAAKSSKTGEVPVLRMGNIQDGHLDWSDLVFTSDADEINKYRLDYGDILFNRTNSPELVGKTAVYKGEREAVYAGYLIKVRCTNLLLPDYLNYCLCSPAGREYCWQVKSDGVSQSNINAKKLAAFTFELPPIDEQTEIVRRVDLLMGYADRLEARLQAAQTAADRLTPALLGKAFRGELVPQDPNDEPAADLLRRLREARATEAPAQPKRGRKAAA